MSENAFEIENPIFFKIDDVISWCEEVVNSCKDFNFDVFTEKIQVSSKNLLSVARICWKNVFI